MICKVCLEDKGISCFYKGNNSTCRKCIYKMKKDYQKEYYPKWYRKNGRRRAKNYQVKILRWQRGNPLSVLAHKFFRGALSHKLIKKPKSCSECGKNTKYLLAHHNDYTRPLDVIWLCSSCHRLIHFALDKMKPTPIK